MAVEMHTCLVGVQSHNARAPCVSYFSYPIRAMCGEIMSFILLVVTVYCIYVFNLPLIGTLTNVAGQLAVLSRETGARSSEPRRKMPSCIKRGIRPTKDLSITWSRALGR